MKSKDQQLLEEAYNKVTNPHQVEENIKGALAAAAMGLGTLAGAQGSDDKHMTYDDYADKASIEDVSVKPEPTIWQAYAEVVGIVNGGSKKIPNDLLKIISKDKEKSKRLAHFLALKGLPTPKILGVGDYSKELRQSFKGA